MGVIIREDKRDLLKVPRDDETWVCHGTRAGPNLVG
jgi:hypothetical protein